VLQKRILGFTLAEVLITLVIIGVVAAMTVPTIVANSQEQAIRSALKKNASVLQQILYKYYMEHGEQLSPYTYETTHTLKPELIKYFNVMYDCGLGNDDVNTACIPNHANASYDQKNQTAYMNYTGTSKIAMEPFDDGQFVLLDGTLVLLENYSATKTIYISVDVNGFGKKPNRLGKDLFMFQLMNDGRLKPMGATGTKYPEATYCSSSSTANMNGAGCTVKVLREKKS
jgi:prepilin-type N-terminal cleavage/methylation domain-containing protein